MKSEKQRLFQSKRYVYSHMPYNSKKVAAILDALTLKNEIPAEDYMEGLYDLVYAYGLGDDVAKALPICAEYFALAEKHPNRQRASYVDVRMAMVAAYVASCLPQIPLNQYKALMNQFHEQVKKYNSGQRLWEMHACASAILLGEKQEAEAHLRAFRKAPRDVLSDSVAYEVSSIAECLLELGRREEAEEILQPVLDGSLVCEQQPWAALSLLIQDSLRHGDVEKSRALGKKLKRKKITRRSDLPYIGALLQLGAYDDNPAEVIPLLEKGIRWSIGTWDQNVVFLFYLGAAVLCHTLGEAQGQVPLSLPKKFPLYQAEGLYTMAELATWLHSQAETIAVRFDGRNGSDYYSKKL